jgi:hypothetical protein
MTILTFQRFFFKFLITKFDVYNIEVFLATRAFTLGTTKKSITEHEKNGMYSNKFNQSVLNIFNDAFYDNDPLLYSVLSPKMTKKLIVS